MALVERSQVTASIVMVRPRYFGFNPQTVDNAFQTPPQASETQTRDAAISEFDAMVDTLAKAGLLITLLDSPQGENGETTPDAIFPNNWISTHPDTMIIYPMKAPNRRLERQPENVLRALRGSDYLYGTILDLSGDEATGNILEGTGSLVLDRTHKIAYALESQRTTEVELAKWCELTGYKPHFFHAVDFGSKPIYHTNVAMSVGEEFAVVCSESIALAEERQKMLTSLRETGHDIVDISMAQMYEMCGNVLQTSTTDGSRLVVMSERARRAFSNEQMHVIEQHGEVVPVAIDTIETVGGGSARCMMAEIFSN